MTINEIIRGASTAAILLMGFVLGYFLWPHADTKQVVEFQNGYVKDCLDAGGYFEARKGVMDQPKVTCTMPEQTLEIAPSLVN